MDQLPYVVAAGAVGLSMASMMMKKDEKLLPTVVAVATGNPQYKCPQTSALKVAKGVPGIESVQPVLDRIYGNSCIDSRYFCVPDFTPEQISEEDPAFFPKDGS